MYVFTLDGAVDSLEDIIVHTFLDTEKDLFLKNYAHLIILYQLNDYMSMKNTQKR